MSDRVVTLQVHRRRLLTSDRLREHIGRGLWAVPLGTLATSLLLAWAMITIGHHSDGTNGRWWAFSGDPASAQEVLSTIATAVLTFTGLVFSIMIVALQLASSQFSPRVMRTFLRDRATQVTLGIFVGTFVYTVVVLQAVRERGRGGAPFVPGEAVTVSMVLVVITVLAFVFFVYHMATSIRVVSIIEAVTRETRALIERRFDAPVDPKAAPLPAARGTELRARAIADLGATSTVTYGAPRAGVLTDVATHRLARIATEHDVVIEILHPLGGYVPGGSPLLRVHGTEDLANAHVLFRHLGLAPERTMTQDVEFGFRQLVDIAARAASPAVDDSTTAVQALERLHDLMRNVGTRPFPTGIHREAGVVRVIVPATTWEELVQLAFAEIRSYAEGSLPVARALRAVLEDLIDVVGPERRVAPAKMLGEWTRGVERGFAEPADRARAGAESARRRIEDAVPGGGS